MNLKLILEKNKEIKLTLLLLILPILLVATTFAFSKIQVDKKNPEEKVAVIFKNPLEEVEVSAEAVLVKDLNTGEILYAKNSGKILPLASITKVLTALTAKELSKSTIASISLSDLELEGDNFLYPNESFNQRDLIAFTLIGSSNDGASALARSINFDKRLFVFEMNKVAQKIGMVDSYFKNEHGLDEFDGSSGANGTARDVSILFEHVLTTYPELLESTSKDSVTIYSFIGISHTIQNTNAVINKLPNILASKTGYTDLAGGNLAVVIDPGLNRPISIVVLGSSKEGRFKDVEILSEKVIEYFSLKSQSEERSGNL